MGDRLPLSQAQAGIFFSQLLDPGNPAYHTADLVELAGPLDEAKFHAAVRTALAEADGLRARFTLDGDEPRQVLDAAPPHVTVVDLRGEADADAVVEARCARDLATVVDLAVGPLARSVLYRLAPDRYAWYLRVHHIAIDGYGMALLLRRCADLYNGARSTPLAPLRAAVEDDAAYQRSARAREAAAFWREYLSGAPAPVSLGRRRTTGVAVPRRVSGHLDVAAVHRLQAAGGRTTAEAAIAAAARWLAARAGAAEVLLGLPVLNRLGTPGARVVTMAMNIVPLRVAAPPDEPFRVTCDRVAEQLRRVRPHQRYRHEQLRRDRRLVGRAGDRLFGPVINVLPFGQQLRFGDAVATIRNLAAGPVTDLSLALREQPGGDYRVELDGHPDGYPTELLVALRDAFIAEVTRVGAPVPRADDTRAAAATPRAILLGEPVDPADGPVDVVRRIVGQARRRPTAIAVADERGHLTYDELATRAHAVAAGLATAGVGPGTLVAVALPRGADAVTALLGVLVAGAAYLPVDPRAPRARVQETVARAAPELAVVDGPGGAPLGEVPTLRLRDLTGRAPGDAPVAVHPDESAYVIYTSGSTGRPKGVEVSRRALARFVAGALRRYGVGPDDRVVQFAPLHFDASVEEIFVTLAAGARLLVRPGDVVPAPDEFLRWCDRQRATLLDLPTAYWHELVTALHTGTARLPDSVRGVIIGGEAALPARVAQWRRTVPPTVALWHTYGPTEATVVAIAADLHRPPVPAAR